MPRQDAPFDCPSQWYRSRGRGHAGADPRQKFPFAATWGCTCLDIYILLLIASCILDDAAATPVPCCHAVLPSYWGLVLAVLSVSRCSGSCFKLTPPPPLSATWAAWGHCRRESERGVGAWRVRCGGDGWQDMDLEGRTARSAQEIPRNPKMGGGCIACSQDREICLAAAISTAWQGSCPPPLGESWRGNSQRAQSARSRRQSRDGVAPDPTCPALDCQTAPRQTGQEPAWLPSRTTNRAPLSPAGEEPLPAVGTAGMEPPQRLLLLRCFFASRPGTVGEGRELQVNSAGENADSTRRSTATTKEDKTSGLGPESHLAQPPLRPGAQLTKENLGVIAPPAFQRKPQMTGVLPSSDGTLEVRRVLIEGLQ